MVTNRQQPAYIRVAAIMTRISRDKYLFPREVLEIAFRVACRVSNNPHASCRSAVPMSCSLAVGMLRGKPPLYHWEQGYSELVRKVREMEKATKRPVLPELVILNIIAAAKKRERR